MGSETLENASESCLSITGLGRGLGTIFKPARIIVMKNGALHNTMGLLKNRNSKQDRQPIVYHWWRKPFTKMSKPNGKCSGQWKKKKQFSNKLTLGEIYKQYLENPNTT